jgi:hypothetical protein
MNDYKEKFGYRLLLVGIRPEKREIGQLNVKFEKKRTPCQAVPLAVGDIN